MGALLSALYLTVHAVEGVQCRLNSVAFHTSSSGGNETVARGLKLIDSKMFRRACTVTV